MQTFLTKVIISLLKHFISVSTEWTFQSYSVVLSFLFYENTWASIRRWWDRKLLLDWSVSLLWSGLARYAVFAMHHAFTTAANTLTDMQLAQQVTPKWSALYIESFQNRSAKFPPELGNSLTCPLWEINLFINFPWCMQNTCKISWTQSCHRWTICGDRNPGRLGGWVGPSRG